MTANGINNPQLYSTPGTQPIGNIVGEIWWGIGAGPFIPSEQVQNSPQLAEATGYACAKTTYLFDWGFDTGYLQAVPPPPPGFLSGTCFAWGGDGRTVGTGINNLTGSSGAIVGFYAVNPPAYSGCRASSQNPGTCTKPLAGTEYAGINDVGWISAATGPDANGNFTAALIAGPTTVNPPYGAGAGGINGFGQMTYSDATGNGYVYDYNGGNSSSPVSMTARVVGINNNNEAVTGSPSLIQDADTPTGRASFGVPVKCPRMLGVGGINDWGQIVGTAWVDADLNVGGQLIPIGDLCIPKTGP